MPLISLLFHDVFVSRPDESGFVSPAANRYKLSVAEFEAQLGGLQKGPVPLFPFLVTVDDGGSSYYTVVADRLEALGWRGHCFVTTDFIGHRGFLTASQIRELDARGHTVGSHSASHPARFSACGVDRIRSEWTCSRAVLEDLLGHAVQTASVPGGFFSPTVARLADEAGIRVLFTSEPSTRACDNGRTTVVGRFTIRSGCRADRANRLVASPAYARYAEWASWNAKKLFKPLLGSTYARVAEWLIAAST